MQNVPIQASANQSMSVVLGGQQVNLKIYTLAPLQTNDTSTLMTHTANQEVFGPPYGQTKAFNLAPASVRFSRLISAQIYKTDGTGRHLQVLGVDYTLSGDTVTFTTAPALGTVLDWVGSYTYYELQNSFIPAGLFIDVNVSDTPICTCIPCFNLNKIVRGQGGFIGHFIFQDTQGNEDPTYDGLGDRFLLQYLEAADL